MNKFVYTITTIIFVIIAGVTAYMVVEKPDTEKPVVAKVQEPVVQEEPIEVAEIEEPKEVVEETAPEPEEPVEEDVQYFKYKVKDASWLHIRAMEGMDNDPIGQLPRGYTGYVVKMTGHWTLLCADGYVGYCSDTYLVLEEIDESEFPEELKGLDETTAGTRIAEGKIGEIEEANTKSVRWL